MVRKYSCNSSKVIHVDSNKGFSTKLYIVLVYHLKLKRYPLKFVVTCGKVPGVLHTFT